MEYHRLLDSCIGKRINLSLKGAEVEGSVKSIDADRITLEDYVQTHLSHSLSINPVESGEHKTFKTSEVESISPSCKAFKPVFTNAYHPSDIPGSSEWWYFLLFDKSAKVMSGKLELQGAQNELKAASDLSIYEKGRQPIFVVNENMKSFEASQECCSVRVGTDCFYEKDGKYCLDMCSGGTTLVLEGKPAKDDQTVSIDFPLNSQGEGVKWVIPSANGTYEGELYRDGKVQKLSGRFFHDHNRDDIKRTLKFMKAFKGWAWGIHYQGEDALLYARCFVDYFPLSLQFRKKDGQFDVITDEKSLSIGKDFKSFSSDFKGDRYEGSMSPLYTAPKFKNATIDRLMNGFGLRKDYASDAEREYYFQVWRRVLFNKGF